MLAHWPRSVVSVWPTRAVPVIPGSCVLAGATAAWTTAVTAEKAGVLAPSAFDAVTRTRSVSPRSSAVMSRTFAVSPAMFTQLRPGSRCSAATGTRTTSRRRPVAPLGGEALPDACDPEIVGGEPLTGGA